jgi:hypothetical protein
VAAVLVTVLSLGYDLTQPLLGGIVTALPALPANRGQALGFNVFTLFVGFGLGSLIFQAAWAGDSPEPSQPSEPQRSSQQRSPSDFFEPSAWNHR